MAVLPTGIGPVTGGYQIERSLRFNSADSAYLNRTPASAGNRKTWTWSGWVKRSALGSVQTLFSAYSANTDAGYMALNFNASDQLSLIGGSTTWRVSNAVYRDISAWYHIVLQFDTTNATATNRARVYVNGSEITWATNNALTLNTDYVINNNVATYLGISDSGSGSTKLFNGYLTEVNFIDGQALTPSSFGQTNASTGVWEPIAYTGTYGTNGFYLNFSDNSGTTSTTLGKDYSGNSNNWTPNNFSVTAGSGNDSLVDTPTNYGTDTGVGGEVRGNYATLNPLIAATVLSNGNLDSSTAAAWRGVVGTLGFPSGKFYYEATITATTNTVNQIFGAARSKIANATLASNGYPGQTADGWGVQFGSTSYKINNGTFTALGSSYSYTTNDVIMVAVDVDAGKFWYGKNGSWIESGNPATGANALFTNLTGEIIPMLGQNTSGNSCSVNFGQRPFAYTAPSGFKALCTQNLPTPTIGATSTTQANDYMNVVLYTGTGSSLGVTGVGFQPDFVWVKGRSGATDHGLYDAVRGVQKQLETNNTGAETTESTGLTAFGTDGFTVGALAQLNTSSATYVAWNWKANGAGSSNTAGTITSTVSANTTSGFSIVTYTGNGTAGATVGHGLGVAPDFIITKSRSGTYNWCVYSMALSSNGDSTLRLNTTDASSNTANTNNDTAPSSTLITLGDSLLTNNNTSTYVAYCFAPVAGYSAFGSFTGNGSTDGPFVYLGFRPRWVLIKSSSAVTNWWVWDTARNTYNVMNTVLYPDLSNAEYSDSSTFLMDDLSNGFKYRTSNSTVNGSGTTYIYAAFAESPFKYSLAR